MDTLLQQPKQNFSNLASTKSIAKTVTALEANRFNVLLAKNKEDAKRLAISLIPDGAEVMNMTSATLDELGISQEIGRSNKMVSVKEKLKAMNRDTDGRRMQQMGAAPEISIGSVHAITESGQIMMASGSGSQIPAHAYGADKVIFVVGTHKIVKDLNEGFERIYSHSLPLESNRLKKVQNDPNATSNVRKILIMNSDAVDRTTVILVPEVLGF